MSTEATAEETTGGEAGPQEPSRLAGGCVVVVLVGVLVLVLKVTVSVAPYVAYFVAGILVTIVWQKGRAWLGGRRDGGEEQPEEESAPDVGEALRRLVGDDNGVLLTHLRDDLKLPDTKAVKQLLDEAGITWKAVRTSRGNGPGVHVKDIPAAPSPAADPCGDGCCCRSDDNDNSDNAEPPQPREGSRVRRIRSDEAVYDPNDNVRRHRVRKGR
ncbi:MULTISPECIES: hypothetical protein [unclassified Streptomyces]|uniref:hypothetical protein n=1 Tax=unclassified Streptomyces TaxID=2593676 RepID=UPI001487B4A7|nr:MULTISPECIES: hypothetical protein [unclassified Streptomyces]